MQFWGGRPQQTLSLGVGIGTQLLQVHHSSVQVDKLYKLPKKRRIASIDAILDAQGKK